ncbi:MAG: MOSC domain-containing protein [Pseudomonadales bacterium]
MRAQQRLFARFINQLKPGELTWIGLRPEKRTAMQVVERAIAHQGLGLEGDHRSTKSIGSARQVTLISEEYIAQIAHFCGAEVVPQILRRNLVVKGINLSALRHQQFQIGEAIFEATALCHPCSRMERALGPGGVAAMLGHGGLCAKVLQGGEIALGDALIPLAPQELE